VNFESLDKSAHPELVEGSLSSRAKRGDLITPPTTEIATAFCGRPRNDIKNPFILSLSKDETSPFRKGRLRGILPDVEEKSPLIPHFLRGENRSSFVGSLRGAQPLLEKNYPLSLEGEGKGEGGINNKLKINNLRSFCEFRII